jgi:uncharacterized protein
MKQIILVLVFLLFVTSTLVNAASQELSSQEGVLESIKVHGVAEKEFMADKAEIVFLVEANDKNVNKVSEKISITSNNLISALEKQDLSHRDIEVLDLSIKEIDKYDRKHSIQSFDHYHGLKKYRLSIYKEKMRYETFYDKVSEAINILLGNGVNQILSLHFMLKDIEDKKNDLLKDAVKNSRKRAEAMVKDLGLVLGPLIYITELEKNLDVNNKTQEKLLVDIPDNSDSVDNSAFENTINLRVEVEAAWKLKEEDPDHKYNSFIGN